MDHLVESKRRFDELFKGLSSTSMAECDELVAEVLKESRFLAKCAVDLHAANESLNTLRDGISIRINVLENDRRPAVSLPFEILAEIFEFGLPVVEGRADMDRETSYLCRITSVCHKWRLAAMETPRLWNVIVCNPHGLGAPSDLPRISDTFLDLERRLLLSKQAPLRVYAQFGHPYSLAIDQPGVTSLLPHLHRLQELTITIRREFPFMTCFFGDGLPALSRLRLTVEGDYDSPNMLPEFPTPKNLKYLSLDFSRRPSSLPLHFSAVASNVTHLHLGIPTTSMADLLLILGHAPMVEQLTLKEYREGAFPRPFTEIGELVLPRLASLEYMSSNGLDLFSHIHMPILETLNITDHSAVRPSPGMLASIPNLRHVISPRIHSSPLVARVLGRHPNVQSLDIHLLGVQLKVLNKLLLQRSSSDPDSFKYWVSLNVLTLHIALDTTQNNTPSEMWGTNISAVMERPNLAINVRFKTRGVPQTWISESKLSWASDFPGSTSVMRTMKIDGTEGPNTLLLPNIASNRSNCGPLGTSKPSQFSFNARGRCHRGGIGGA